jgi:alkanesulfonate monooxygenase SsuD/methylene tetrahydromethanopterin reductase-like flavin-dependent oxidoreductase (luciferase family)
MTPFAPGTISFSHFAHEGPPEQAVATLLRQARLIEAAGFDGVTLSEHHGGYGSYLPSPLLMAVLILGATERVWSGPVPMVLPLRSWQVVAEDLSWAAAAYPGRVGAGFAPGYMPRDFELLGVDFDSRVVVFERQLRAIGATLGRGEELTEDPAVADRARSPVPVVSTVGSATAARRAADAGAGILLDSINTPQRLRDLVWIYRERGRDGPVVLNRRIWVGELPQTQLQAQLSAYQQAARPGEWIQDTAGEQQVASGSPDRVVDQLLTDARTVGATALALRVHVDGVPADQVEPQIERLGAAVLPQLHAELA